jgi:hypothetical protein
MPKPLSRVRRTESEEIRISLQEVHGEPHLELRVYRRAPDGDATPLPEPEAILIPLRVLPEFCRTLVTIEARLLKERQAPVHATARATTMEDGEPVTLCLGDPNAAPLDARSEPRVRVRMAVECHLLKVPDIWPRKPLPDHVAGEIRDVSKGGAQAWLPESFPIATHFAVFMRIGEMTFRGQAEVVGAAPEPTDGLWRHNLQWNALSEQASAALAQLIGPRQ